MVCGLKSQHISSPTTAHFFGTLVEDVQCCPLLLSMMTRPFINTYGMQHFKQYVYRGIEQYKRDMYLNDDTQLLG